MPGPINFYPSFELKGLTNLLLAGKDSSKEIEKILSEYFGRQVILVNSARTGIYLSLAAKGIKRIDEILVPKYLSQCVLNAITHTAFPVLEMSDRVKAMLVLHQYGYPQKMEEILSFAKANNIFVIEDCAHTFSSLYDNKKAGTFGDSAVFSFSKIFPTIMGGCIVTDDEDVISYSREYLRKQKSLSWSFISNLSLIPILLYYLTTNLKHKNLLSHWLEVFYSQYIYFPNPNKHVSFLLNNALNELKGSIQTRANNYRILKESFASPYYEQIESKSVVDPLLFPIWGDVKDLTAHSNKLKNMGITSEIVHFDVERNLLNPNYVKCLTVPCHQQISEEILKKIIEKN